MVEIFNIPLQSLMGLVLEEVPLKGLVVVPFPPLAKLTSHKQGFFTRLTVHITQKQTEVSKLLPIVPGHLG